jgi:hypothetical protein
MAFIEIAARVAEERSALERADRPLVALLSRLKALDYSFVTPTPATYARVVTRSSKAFARSLEDVLGWSRPFESGTIDATVQDLLDEAELLNWDRGIATSSVRVSSLGGRLFLHSAYPTSDSDAVFFGPDSYRFADLLRAELGTTAVPARAYP